jgi:hypothetical protein
MHSKILFIPIIIALLVIPADGFCQGKADTAPVKGSPEWLVYQYFASDSFPDYKEYIVSDDPGFMPPLAGMFGDSVDVTYRPLRMDSDYAVYAVSADKDGEGVDLYCHMVKRNGEWKIKWTYALALTGMYYMLIDSVSAMPVIPDSIRYMYENAKLVISLDKDLKEYLKEHIESFAEAKNIFESDTNLTRIILRQGEESMREAIEQYQDVDDSLMRSAWTEMMAELDPGEVSRANKARVQDLIDKLHLSAVRRGPDSIIVFSIGGMVDNEVGFMYIPEGTVSPALDGNPYIYVEEIIPRWYIYKTT